MMMLSSNILVEKSSKNCVLDKEDSRERYLSCQDFQKVALSWMAKIDKKMSSLSRCGGNTSYKSAFAFGKLLMSEDAEACFNVSSGSLKKNLKTYTLYHMIQHDAKICECHSGILEFLRQSGTRLNQKVLKMNNAANAK
ncbi:uncharacterized protein LOC136078735 [Hydra vulgaris]|uniref:Uncharacterized protein LOC136078735 n=1 Tax=Hydra vulgaris TaxID=6087 RepID=A0ABM4BND9_HYDVU